MCHACEQCTCVLPSLSHSKRRPRAINVHSPTPTSPSACTHSQTKNCVILSQHVSVASPVDQCFHPTSKKKKKHHFVPLCPFPLRSGAWVRLNNHWDRGAFHLGDILSRQWNLRGQKAARRGSVVGSAPLWWNGAGLMKAWPVASAALPYASPNANGPPIQTTFSSWSMQMCL